MAKDKLKEQAEMLKQQEKMQKKVVDHEVLLSTWISNRMEQDKQVLTLSALAVGLLATFRSDICDCFSFMCWFFAGVCFLISIGLILWTFGKNSEYIALIQDEGDEREKERFSKFLEYLTRFALFFFGVGVFLTCVLAVYIVTLSF